MIKIFLDTNILIKSALMRYKHGKLSRSLIKDYNQSIYFLISEYVISECHDVLSRYIVSYESEKIYDFLDELWVRIVDSTYYDSGFLKYVSDINDVQIVRDAYQNNALLVVSQNIKDFHIHLIQKELHMDIITLTIFKEKIITFM